jgi:hypothetical protein
MDHQRLYFRLICTIGLLSLAGCAEKLPEFGLVTGTVTAKGKPLKGMIVTFMPDPTQGNELPYNGTGQTDEKGKYELHYAHKGHSGAGAAVGWNRVVVIDTRYSSVPQGAPLPPRLFPPAYSIITSTPLKFEVKAGPQTIDLDLK